MKSFEIGMKGVFVNYFTIEAEDEEAAINMAHELFSSDSGDCIDVDVLDCEEIEEENLNDRL